MKRGALLPLLSLKSNTNPLLSFTHKLGSSAAPTLAFYSSSSKCPQTLNGNSSEEVDDVSNQELKRRIDKYLEGDEEAIPSIFEAILKRKLAGKHEESDDELMQEIRAKTSNDAEEDECNSEEDT